MGIPDECSDHKIIDRPNSCYGFDHDGKFCDVWYLMKQKYPHIKGTKDIASATLMFRISCMTNNIMYDHHIWGDPANSYNGVCCMTAVGAQSHKNCVVNINLSFQTCLCLSLWLHSRCRKWEGLTLNLIITTSVGWL